VLLDTDDDPVRASLLVAGHPLPLLVRAGQVNPDGVPEARGESDRFGDDRLRASLSSLSAVSNPTQTVTQVESALESFLVGPPQNDAAMLVVLRPGTALPARPSGSLARAAALAGSGPDGFGRGGAG
jgi:hypothetical protein